MFKKDQLNPLNSGDSKIYGYVGDRIDKCIQNGVMASNYNLFVRAYKEKTDDKDGGNGFSGEFFGKWFTSAALAYRYQPSEKNRKIIEDAIEKLMECQEESGRLSSYSNDFGDWDIWGRKYSLLALVAYYEQTGCEKALTAGKRAVDALIEVAGDGKVKLTETGLTLIQGLSSCSILEPVVLIYKYSLEEKYLEFAKYLVKLFAEPSSYSVEGLRLIENALDDTHPMYIAAPKGYEMMSCYEGICELYRVTRKEEYLETVQNFAQKVIDKEIMITGSGSSAELWCDGVNRQTELLEQPMETCVTATWMKLCYQLLRITGDSKWADQMEITLYNSLLSAMMPNGDWWAYFTQLAGERMPSPIQVEEVQSSCCVVNGPRALMTVPQWSVMQYEKGIAVLLFTKGEWNFTINNKKCKLSQLTDYPRGGKIKIIVNQEEAMEYTIKIRIPFWSKQNFVSMNGVEVECISGKYLDIKREWKDGDVIEFVPDLRGRIITAPAAFNQKAIMRGPVVLALDTRLVKETQENLWLDRAGYHKRHDKNWDINYILLDTVEENKEEEYIEIKICENQSQNIWMSFEVDFIVRPTHFVKHEKRTLLLCDYASAGNEYSSENMFRVWMSLPMFMNAVFPKNTWKILYHENGIRPTRK